MKNTAIHKAGALALGVLLLATLPVAAGQFADMVEGPNAISFATKVQHGGTVLTVTGPNGFVHQGHFAAGEEPLMGLFDKAGTALEDGNYTWELRLAPALSPAMLKSLADARAAGDDSLAADLRKRGHLPTGPRADSGYFNIAGGALVSDAIEEGPGVALKADIPIMNAKRADGPQMSLKDQVILDDLIVDGSACVGQDCVNGESFGFDTIRLKENNLRIKFQDTSNSASFPTNDWQLTANDTSNGGANKFSIDDIDGGRTPFTIEASAPSHSLYVDDGGRIGLGTATPVVEVHIVDGDSPTIRLEQDGSSGFTPQTWDVAGNETNFFVRDATNGSKLPFRIRPNAPSQSLYINTNGDIGLGTSSPEAKLHAIVNGSGSALGLMTLENNGRVRFDLEDTNSATTIRFLGGSNGLDVIEQGTGEIVRYERNAGAGYSVGWELGTGADVASLANNGAMVALSFTPSSDRNLKENFEPVDGNDVLEKLAGIEISRWNFISEGETTPHVGPMAQDFYSAFGLGMDDRHISTVDADGVALAAIQALHQQLQDKDAMIRKLEERLTALENQTP